MVKELNIIVWYLSHKELKIFIAYLYPTYPKGVYDTTTELLWDLLQRFLKMDFPEAIKKERIVCSIHAKLFATPICEEPTLNMSMRMFFFDKVLISIVCCEIG